MNFVIITLAALEQVKQQVLSLEDTQYLREVLGISYIASEVR